MRFQELGIVGVYSVTSERVSDARGDFTRTFSALEFRKHGLVEHFAYQAMSRNSRRGTVRGLHYQAAPHAETKLICCTAGSIFDVVVDLRANSPTRGQWLARELDSANLDAIYIPAGCAHGYQTLTDNSEVAYMITPEHIPVAARGLRWDDAVLGIPWPITADVILSEQDHRWPSLEAVMAAAATRSQSVEGPLKGGS